MELATKQNSAVNVPKKAGNFFGQKNESPFFPPVFIQPKLTIGTVDDPYEREADAIADKVMRMSDGETLQTKPSPVTIQRKCAACEEEEKLQRKCAHCEEEEKLQMKGESGASGGMIAPPVVHDVINSGGQSLDAGTKNFMESRFGYDFGNVKIHNDSLAHQSSAAINALAYTNMDHVVFGAGQYQPNANNGKQLLAHELTHVVQQNDNNRSTLQRMTIGVGPIPYNDNLIDGVLKPGWSENKITVVPEGERKRVTDAIGIIQNIIDHPDEYKRCFETFEINTPAHSPTAFKETFERAIIWKVDIDAAGLTLPGDDTNIGYTRGAYDIGARYLAQTIIHEMGHICGITNDENHSDADVIANYCIGPQTGIALQTDPDKDVLLSYRKFFDLAFAGKLQFTAGAEFNLSVWELPSKERPMPIANFTGGLQLRSNIFGGGADFGGLIFGAEAGLGIDNFKVDRTTGPEFELGMGAIVKTYLGGEFFIPTDGGVIQTFSVELGRRDIIPLNSEAEKITEYTIGVTYRTDFNLVDKIKSLL